MRALPQILPAGLYEAAARRGVPRQGTGSRPTSDGSATGAISRQFSGQGFPNPTRPPQQAAFQSPVQTGDQWVISPQDKAQFDGIFARVDPQNRGFITGDQAVTFFSNARLSEEALAQIWDLADINSEGQLNRDEFAVAMYLIRQQRAKRDGRDVLPQVLPPNLVPPSMRRQPIAPAQPTAPAFDNAANITKPKSASEDLFGLDAISTPPPPTSQPKVPNDPIAFSPTSPTRSQTSPPQPPPPPASQPSHFKPFVPSSTFGQTIMTPQGTGTSSSTSPLQIRGIPPAPQKQGSAMDDLLGDNDPEVSKRLTNETSELANLSNQVTSLSNQMSEVKTNRGKVDQELTQTQSQKRDFEARLAQLRAAYQQEVKEVQALEESLRTSRDDTKRLQSDMALIQGSHEDLLTQHQKAAEALNTDQAENARLKEKISETNAQITALKPKLEKLRLDARQQRGLVAIYKKQLAGSENERGKVQGDLDGASKDHEEATKEVEEHKQAAETASQAATRGPSTAPVAAAAAAAAAAVTSPAPSTGSMNPFFRRTSTVATGDRGLSSPFTPPTNATSSNHSNAFDSFFGPSAPAASSGPPPSTSFMAKDTPIQTVDAPAQPHSSQDSSEDAGEITPSRSPPTSTFSDSPSTATEPPAPPQSRQITSSFLPLRPNLEHSGSESSSVKVVPPASRMGESSTSGVATPTRNFSDSINSQSLREGFAEMGAKPPQLSPPEPSPKEQDESFQDALSQPQESSMTSSIAGGTSLNSASQGVPGAFPGDDVSDGDFSTVVVTQPSTVPEDGSVVHPPASSKENVEGIPASAPGNKPLTTQDDFESAFGDFDQKGKAPEQVTNGFATSAAPKNNGEFPPIRELGGDDESESEDEKGFQDDFSHSTYIKDQASEDVGAGASSEGASANLAPTRPPFQSTESANSQLPTPNAQSSPPPYDQTTGTQFSGTGDRKDSSQFPAEYSGLLPSRETPIAPITSPHETSGPSAVGAPMTSASAERGLDFVPDQKVQSSPPMPMSPGASTAAPYAYTQSIPPASQPNPPLPPKTVLPKDDFEDEFGDLSEAKEASDHGEDDIPYSKSRNTDLDDFNPIFDSPIPSRTVGQGSQSSSTFPQTDSFADFEASPATGSGPVAQQGSGTANANASHDWDAIFAGLDAPQNNGVQAADDLGFTPTKSAKSQQRGVIAPEGKKTAPSADVYADDADILKRLTGMGYPRDKSLKALEKYDYNIDKVRNLTPAVVFCVIWKVPCANC